MVAPSFSLKLLAVLLVAVSPCAHAQSIDELYDRQDFEALTQARPDPEGFSAEELYMIGFAFFRMEDDVKAIAHYDQAIAKGLDNGRVYLSKGVSLRYMGRHKDAMKAIEQALKLEPGDQEIMNEKAMILYDQEEYDQALIVLEQAVLLPTTFPQVYYWIPRIHLIRKDLAKALPGFYLATEKIPVESDYHAMAWARIGTLEYRYTRDYAKATTALERATQLDPADDEIRYDLICVYNAVGRQAQADSVFAIEQTAFQKGLLPKEDMEIKTIPVAHFEWNGHKAEIRRCLVDPVETLDISYKVFVLNEAGDKVERRFLVEKTFQIGEDGARHLLCERDKESGDHITYRYGWSTDTINIADLQKAVVLVLDGKMKRGASSNFDR